MIPPVFLGQTVAIIGGGTSLDGFDFRQLDRHPTIALNRALEFLPRAHVLWWSDPGFFRRNRAAIEAHAAFHKATGNLGYQKNELPDWVHEYTFTGHSGFDPDPRCLRHGNNSAFAAMHLAAHLGASEIVLFGVDMRHGQDGKTHFHGGHGLVHLEDTMKTSMLPLFASLVKPLAKKKIRVVNASPNSALQCWPRCSISDGVALVQKASAHGRVAEVQSASPSAGL